MSATLALAEAVATRRGGLRQADSVRLADMVLDLIGCAVAGAEENAPRACRNAAVVSPGDAVVFGSVSTVSAADAALANGAAGHALDHDDVQQPWFGHPSTVLVPAAWAAADVAMSTGERVTGPALLQAVRCGLVVGDALGSLLNTAHYDAGWHPTGTIGAIAAAATVAHLWGLDLPRTTHALGIAAASASGLRVSFGTDSKPLQAGIAARAGLSSTALARSGATSAPDTLEGTNGFAKTHGGIDITGHDVARSLTDAGEKAIQRVSFKRYPSCAATSAALDGVLRLRADAQEKRARSIHCSVDPLATRLLVHHRPTTGAQAKFSMEYCLAAAWIHGRLGPAEFTPEALSEPDLRALLKRVEVTPDQTVVPTGDFPARVTVTFEDGSTATADVARAQGRPDDPLTREQLAEKYASNVSNDPAWVAVGTLLHGLPECDDLREIEQALKRPAPVTKKEMV